MAYEKLTLKVKTGEKDGTNFWDRCGVVFINRDEAGNITSVSVKHNMFPNVDMVAYPPRAKDEEPEVTED